MQNQLFEQLQLFTRHLNQRLRAATADFSLEEKEALGPLCGTLLKKWVYSTLFQESALSPTNLIQYPGVGCEIRLALHGSLQADTGFLLRMMPVADSTSSHHCLRDLQLVCQNFLPVGRWPKTALFPLLAPKEIRSKLYTDDPYYYQYLLLMAERLHLIRKMPGICSDKYQQNEAACQDFFALPVLTALERLVEETLSVAVVEIETTLQAPARPLSVEDIRSFLSHSYMTDDLFSTAYGNLGFDFAELNEMAQEEHLPPEDEALLSTAYTMGMVFDKWIFTPLGHYLSLLRPLYVLPYGMTEEIDWVRPTLLTGCDMSHEFFSPCNYFSLTSLGEAVLHTVQESPLPSDFPPLSLRDLEALLAARAMAFTPPPKVRTAYVLTVQYANDPLCWKWVEAFEDTPLEELYQSLLSYFGLEGGLHQFFLLPKTHASTTASHPLSQRWTYRLKELHLEENELLLHFPHLQDCRLKISLQLMRQIAKKETQPRLLRQSREITLEEREEFEP